MTEPRADAPMAIVPWWIETHPVIPDGFRAGRPFRLYDDQLRYFAAFYTVRGDVEFDPANPLLASAFRYRRGMRVAPQKEGKSPASAAHVCVEGVGPSVFAGWAKPGDVYRCIDWGCGCGQVYEYEPGEPMGMPRPTPNIQIIAISEDQTGNIYDALRPMIEKGPLRFLMPKTGESLIRLPGDGIIEPVTSSDTSRLGQRVTFVVETEVGLYTQRNGMTKVADTLHRNLAGMSARASLETNAWDPSQNSTAQREYELVAKGKIDDVYVQVTWPPASLSFTNKAERRRILRLVYPADTLRENGGHVDLDAIESEAIAMIEHDPAQASRFFGNKLTAGSGKAFDIERWRDRARKSPYEVKPGARITIGIDGSRLWDHFPIVATEVETAYQWPLGIWTPAGPGREVPMDAVDQVLVDAFEEWTVLRLYGDPPYIESWMATWAGRWGKDRVIEWATARIRPMAYALRSWHGAIQNNELSHCAESDDWCALFTEHVGNAVRRDTGLRDELGTLWTVEKDRDGSPDKIDSVPAGALSWEARNDVIAAGLLNDVDEASAYDDLTEEQVLERMLV